MSVKPPAASKGSTNHIQRDIEQTQIAFAYPSVPMESPDFYAAIGAVGVLSQDMASRLFSEVREKYGLCYTVSAWHEKFRDRAAILCFAGAKPEKAQETLERTIHEHRRLVEGIPESELNRVKIGLKASLVMRQESTSSRAASLLADWYYLSRVRPLAELNAKIEGITPATIVDYLTRYPADNISLVTLGSAGLTLPG